MGGRGAWPCRSGEGGTADSRSYRTLMSHKMKSGCESKICSRSFQFHSLNGFFGHKHLELELVVLLRKEISEKKRTREEVQHTISISFTFRFNSLYFAWYFSSSTPAAIPVVYALLFCLVEGATGGGWTNIWELGRAEGPGDWLWDMMAVLRAASKNNEALSWHLAIYRL